MTQELAKQVAIVTGGTGALGQAVTLSLLEAGARVIVPYRVAAQRELLETEAGEYGTQLMLVDLDVMDASAVEGLVSGIMSDHGRLDILAHLVGGYRGGTDVQDLGLGEWREMLDANLTSAFICCRAVLPVMRERRYGRIIAVSSRAAVRPSSGISAYTASKAGLLAFIECIAEENHRQKITANAVLPSVIDTAANRAAMPNAKFDQWPKPKEIAAVIRFLAGPESSLISGAAIPVYGRA